MKIKNLDELEPKLRQRILAQIQTDKAEASEIRGKNRIGLSRSRPGEHQQKPRSKLLGGGKRKRAGNPDCGRRYRIELTVHTVHPTDFDNTTSAAKRLIDCIVEAGWLPDGDGWRELEGEAKAVKCAHKREQRTVAILTRIH